MPINLHFGTLLETVVETEAMYPPNTHVPDENDADNKPEALDWDNPSDPESASDTRDIEQLERQKKEAELRKSNLSDESKEELKP